jgi:hypothetical protein
LMGKNKTINKEKKDTIISDAKERRMRLFIMTQY